MKNFLNLSKETSATIVLAVLGVVIITTFTFVINFLGEGLVAQTISGVTSTTTSSSTPGTSGSPNTTALYPDTYPPTVPANLSASDISASGFKLQWDNSSDPSITGQITSGIKGYNIFRNGEANPSMFISDKSFVFTGIPSGTTNRFTVASVDMVGNSSGQTTPIYVTTSMVNTTTQAPIVTPTTTYPTTTLLTPTSNSSTSSPVLITTQPQTSNELYVNPPNATIYVGGYVAFKAFSSSGVAVTNVSWNVYETNGGVINSNGEYSAPSTPGVYHIIARSTGYIDKYAVINVTSPYAGLKTNTTATTTLTTPISTPAATPSPSPVTVPTQTKEISPITPVNVTVNPPVSNQTPETVKGSPTNTTVSPAASGPTTAPQVPMEDQGTKILRTAIAVQQIRNLNSSVGAINTAIDENRQKLIEVVDKRIANLVAENKQTDIKVSTTSLVAIKAKIIGEFDSSLVGTTTITTTTIKNLSINIEKDLNSINSGTSGFDPNKPSETVPSPEVAGIFGSLNKKVIAENVNVKKLGGDLLYRDSNKDGISDYESVYLYNMDPVKPSPVTEYNGKKISAGEKAILGFDPTSKNLVKVAPEDPKVSVVVPTETYKVKEVQLTQDKKILVKGRSLPNSLVTIYIYSTPIIVTVKANSSGEWEYTLDKEIETGEHKIYTASVNNSGKIIAKSSDFTFIKTAEAAALTPLIPQQSVSPVQKPGLMDNWTIYIIALLFIGIVIISIGLLSFVGKNKDQAPPTQNPPTITT